MPSPNMMSNPARRNGGATFVFHDLDSSCTKICKNDEGWNFIKRAFFLRKRPIGVKVSRSGRTLPPASHRCGQDRRRGDRPRREIGRRGAAARRGGGHGYTVEDMERIFGPKIASMVDGLTKMSGVFNADTSGAGRILPQGALTLSDDVRVILIQDRRPPPHNMRTLGSMPMNKQIKITGETIYLFAPLRLSARPPTRSRANWRTSA